jgi:hypothetical protein
MRDGSVTNPMPLGKALGLSAALFVAFVLVFLFVPQWLIVDLRAGSRALRVWLAVFWVGGGLVGAGALALRMTRRHP